ncbi:MAG: LpxI family protein [Spirochaetales bacterium]|nr:LpxI family protein [Spirochaetales bacterium]
MTEGRLGILAGTGELPWIAARNALRAGEDIRILPFTSDPWPEDLADFCRPVVLTRFFRSVIKTMQEENVRRLLLLGKARRDILYRNPSFDLRSIWLLLRSASQSDTSLFLRLAQELEKRGITIVEQPLYLREFFLEPGRYGRRLSGRELRDVLFALKYARTINALDVGQAVVCGQRAILAIECAEGTDACIVRGGELFQKKGAVVCKVAKKEHDLRFDMPVVGASTLFSMLSSGCRVLAIEAGRTFVVEPDRFRKQAREAGITILALDPEATDERELQRMNRFFYGKG